MTTTTGETATLRSPGTDAGAGRRALIGLAAGAFVVAAGMLVPVLSGVDVKAGGAAPLLGDWMVRFWWTSPVAVLVAVLTGWAGLPAYLDRLPWRRLLMLSWVASVVWMVSLALVDGPVGMGKILNHGTEYLESARMIDDVGEMLRTYVSRIPLDAPGHWAVHLAGHPPGAVLMFIGLDRIGLGAWQVVGVIIVAIGATVPAAVALTLDRLGARDRARAALPFLVIGPAALLMAVSADAVFTAIGAWGAASLAGACAARRPVVRWGLAVLSGLLFGWCVMVSYGLLLIGALALAVLVASRGSARERAAICAVAVVAALAVVLAFAAFGFAWWEAFPILRERYSAGIAQLRPGWYWVFGNIGALVLIAGPMLPAALAAGWPRLRDVRGWAVDPVPSLVVAGVVMVGVANFSLMSKAEVERIWLPFMPWLLLSVLWLPPRWQRWALLAQAVTALLIEHFIRLVW
ncbi:MAG: hypothetical protein ABIU87_07885 [Ornithinibacter sp.]